MFNTNITKLNYEAFFVTWNLISIKFPESLTTIRERAFLDSSVRELSFGPNLQYIYLNAIECSSVDKIIVSPQNSYFYVENGCLYEISTNKLVRVTTEATKIRSNVSSIEMVAFKGSLIDVVQFDENLLTIGTYTFYSSSYLKLINLSRTKITLIPNNNFLYLPNLKEVIFPETLKSLSTRFESCPKFKTLLIPSSVNEIEPNILSSSNGIKNVVYLGSTDFSFSPNNTNLATIYVSRIYPSSLFGNTTVRFYDSYNSILSFLYPTRITCRVLHHIASNIFILYVFILL